MNHPSAFYTGLVADVYSRLKSTSFSPERYARLIQTFGEPALELGCGDGDPLLDLRALGIDVDGIDSSADMLERLRERAGRRGLAVETWCTPMETMAPPRRYRTVFLAGPTFNLLPDDRAMGQALRAIRRALAEGGTAVVPLFVPEPVAPGTVGTVTSEDNGEETISCTVLAATRDDESRTQSLTLRYERRRGQHAERVDRDWLIHWIDLARFEALAVDADLRVVSAPATIGEDPGDVVLRAG